MINEPWFFAVRGNHEQMMIEAIKLSEKLKIDNNVHLTVLIEEANLFNHWEINGGLWHKSVEPNLLSSLVEKANKLPYVIVIGEGSERFNIVHAEMIYNSKFKFATDEDIDAYNFDDINESSMLWGRSMINHKEPWLNMKEERALSTTICGHTPLESPLQLETHMFIDTGACFKYFNSKINRTYRLSMVCLQDMGIYSLDIVND